MKTFLMIFLYSKTRKYLGFMDKQHIVDEINVKVYKNGEGKIKGEVLNSVLIDIISFIEDRVTALKEDLVFITEEEYEALVSSGTVDENKIYFILESND